jgi:hypothetical protein
MSSSDFHPINTDRAHSPDASKECQESDSLDKLRWWQKATIYQILIQSFQDTDGDGKGDLRGIVNHLDYFVALGIDVVWISPIYESPMRDMGYEDELGHEALYRETDEKIAGMTLVTIERLIQFSEPCRTWNSWWRKHIEEDSG